MERDLAALVGLGLTTAGAYPRVREWLSCRACGRRGSTLHHIVPNWICRATGAKEVLESLCPGCHSAAELLHWKAAELALQRHDLLAIVAKKKPTLRPAIAAWQEWTRWQRRSENLEKAGRDAEDAKRRAADGKRALGKIRGALRDAIRREAASICLGRIDYPAMAPAWRAAKSVGALDARRFVT